MEEMESAQPWMKQDSDSNVQTMLAGTEKRKSFAEHKNHYKIIADLMKGKEVDITGDVQLFANLNKERMAVEDYMKLFPEHTNDAIIETNRIKAEIADGGNPGRDYNPKSLAKWRIPGIMPRCVAELYMEVYEGDKKAMYSAFKRFFNEFPAFRISDKRA